MTIIFKYIQNFFKPQKQYFFFRLSSGEKKKIVLKAVENSNKMQVSLLEKYRKQFPNDRQQFYTN